MLFEGETLIKISSKWNVEHFIEGVWKRSPTAVNEFRCERIFKEFLKLEQKMCKILDLLTVPPPKNALEGPFTNLNYIVTIFDFLTPHECDGQKCGIIVITWN